MLKITIELLPGGYESKKRILGTMTIVNDLSSNGPTVGNYIIKIFKWADKYKKCRKSNVWKRGTVKNFPREKLGPWDLLLRALQNTIGDRNK